MSEHSLVRDSLYEYAMGELPAGERERVERHIQNCQQCTGDLEQLRETVGLVRRPALRMSDTRPDSYWQAQADAIDGRIRRNEAQKSAPAVPRFAELLDMVWNNRKSFSLAAGSLAVAAVALVLLVRKPPPPLEQSPPAVAGMAVAATDTQNVKKMTQYLRQSKNLLVGLTNMKIRPESPGDIAAEREISRQLLQEARVLRETVFDPRSVELLDNIDGILVKVAGTDEPSSLPDIDLLRRGIREQNLLFKVRMAETALQSTMTAGYRK